MYRGRDYSFLYTGNFANLTTKWWITNENITENGMYGQRGILFNSTIWDAYKGTILVSIAVMLFQRNAARNGLIT